jgi:hypothetical protein
MSGACSTHDVNEKYVQNVGRKAWKEVNYLEDLGVDGKKWSLGNRIDEVCGLDSLWTQ